MKLISFVIPVFRNEGSLTTTYKQNKAAVKKAYPNCKCEFVFVDDGSDDGSLAELVKIQKKDKRVTILQLSRNFGQRMAVIAGLHEVKGEAVIVMSADLQDPPSMVPKMIKAYEAGNQVVICHREKRQDGLFKSLTSRIYFGLLRMTYPNAPEGGFDYFLLGGKAHAAYKTLNDRNRVTQVDVLWLGFDVALLPYTRLARKVGRSQYNFSKYFKMVIDGLIDSSYIPIRFISLVGILTAFLGFSYALWVVFRFFNNRTPFEGYAPIVIILLVVGGLIMLMLGILGEYIWRIYHETRKRPHFIIKNKFKG